MQLLALLVVVAAGAAGLPAEPAEPVEVVEVVQPAEAVEAVEVVDVVPPAEVGRPLATLLPAALLEAVQSVLPEGAIEAGVVQDPEDLEDQMVDGEPLQIREDLPESLPKTSCPRNEKTKLLSNCMRQNFQTLVPHLRKGGKYGLPSLEPFHIPEASTLVKAGPLEFIIVGKNMSMDGLTNVVVRDVRANLKSDQMALEADLTFAKLICRGQFEINNGKIATITFHGRGPFRLTFRNVVATWYIRGEKKADSQFMRVTSASPSYTVGGMTVWGEGVAGGNKALNDLVIVLANRLWSELVYIGKPYVQGIMSGHIKALSDGFFKNMTYDSLFPTDVNV